jgi:hypothetical protein
MEYVIAVGVVVLLVAIAVRYKNNKNSGGSCEKCGTGGSGGGAQVDDRKIDKR